MTRLIDVDRLIFHSCPDMKGDCPYWGSGNCGVCQKAIITRAEIDNAPTVEFPEQVTIKCDTEEDRQKLLSAFRNARVTGFVEFERPQGKWEYVTHYARRYRVCPFCTSEKEDDRSSGWNYCWHCGADMKGE